MKNSCESIKRFQKNNIVNSQTIKILFQAYYFPGFSGYSAGGSEKALFRLTARIDREYPNEYSLFIYVMQKKLSDRKSPLPKIIKTKGNPSKISILPFLFKQQKNFDILNIFSFYLPLNFTSIFIQNIFNIIISHFSSLLYYNYY